MRLLQKIFRRLLNIKGEEVATVPFGANGLIFAEVLKQATDLPASILQLKQIQSAVGDIVGIIEAAEAGATVDEKAFASAEKNLEDLLAPLVDPSLGLSDAQVALALKGLDAALNSKSAAEDPEVALALGSAKSILGHKAYVEEGMPETLCHLGALATAIDSIWYKLSDAWYNKNRPGESIDGSKVAGHGLTPIWLAGVLEQAAQAGGSIETILPITSAAMQEVLGSDSGVDSIVSKAMTALAVARTEKAASAKAHVQEDKSMSTGTIKIMYKGEKPLSGDLSVNGAQALALKGMSEHLLDNLAPGKYTVALKCGDGWDFETEVEVLEGAESAVVVDFGQKAGKPPWLEDDEEDEMMKKEKKAKSDKEAADKEAADAAARAEADAAAKAEADKVAADKVVTDPAVTAFEQKTASALEELLLGVKGLTETVKTLTTRVDKVETDHVEQKKVQADKAQQGMEDDWCMLPGTIPSYSRSDKAKPAQGPVDMDDFVDPMDLTSSPLFSKAQQAYKKGNLG